MGQLVLQLSNSENWESIYNESHVAQRVATAPERYYPIPEVVLPFLLERHILAVSVFSNNAKPYWHYAGTMSQRISLGLVVGGGPDADSVSKRKIWLNQTQLIIFPKLTSTYSVAFKAPYWFEDFTLTVWQYIGPESDSTESLIRDLEADLIRIEAKLDTHAGP